MKECKFNGDPCYRVQWQVGRGACLGSCEWLKADPETIMLLMFLSLFYLR